MPIPQLTPIKHSSFKSSGHKPAIKLPKNKKEFAVLSWLWFKQRGWKALSTLILLGVFCLVCLFFWYSKDLPNPNKLRDRAVAQSTKIYDRTGTHLLYEIHGDQKRTLIQLTDLPPYVAQATIALEDKNFYTHSGFSLIGIIRSVLVDLLQGRAAQGGSTLTQQFVKNALLTGEKSIPRKIKELILSYQLEQKYSKQEILQMYFNEIPYGSIIYGIQAAAQTYFNKDAKNLTLAEATALAALTNAPTALSPWGKNKARLIERQHYALDQMVAQKYITAEAAEAAKNEPLNFQARLNNIEAPHFVFYVRDWLSNTLGSQLVDEGGLKIITTLDYDLQKKAEELITTQGEINQKDWDASTAAEVALDNQTGQILSMVGSRDFFDDSIDGQVNAAISPRQPGSSFKPIVYTEAWLKGYRPESLIFDLETDFPVAGQPLYHPKNYDLKTRGPISLRQALAGSLNIPAVKLLYLVGTESVLDLAAQLGYTTLTDRSRFGLSLVLGGGEVTLLEHTNAFATLAREGTFLPTTPILRVENGQGEVLEEFDQNKLFPKKVLDPNIAEITSDVLSDNNARAFIFGAQNYLTLPDRLVAAKTGTTNNYHDAWTMGYTPSYSVGVWVGNNKNQAMKKGADGSKIAAPIWQGVFKQLTAGKPVESFVKPVYDLPNKPMLNGVLGEKVKIERTTGLLATSSTPPELIDERVFTQVHDVLQYVDKNDPLGPIPSNPSADPYYQLWEKPVQAWAQKNGYTNAEAPTDYETIHQSQDQPQVAITTPQNNQVITTTNLPIALTVQAPKGQQRGRVLLDNTIIKDFDSETFFSVSLPKTTIQGPHQLTVYVYDTLGNRGQATIPISLAGDAFLSVAWSNQPASLLTPADWPLNLIITATPSEQIKKVDYYWKKPLDSDFVWLGSSAGSLQNSDFKVVWKKAPDPGTYQIRPSVILTGGEEVYGEVITITISPTN